MSTGLHGVIIRPTTQSNKRLANNEFTSRASSGQRIRYFVRSVFLQVLLLQVNDVALFTLKYRLYITFPCLVWSPTIWNHQSSLNCKGEHVQASVARFVDHGIRKRAMYYFSFSLSLSRYVSACVYTHVHVYVKHIFSLSISFSVGL